MAKRRITYIVENFHYWNRNGWTGWFSRVTRTSDGAIALIADQADFHRVLLPGPDETPEGQWYPIGRSHPCPF